MQVEGLLNIVSFLGNTFGRIESDYETVLKIMSDKEIKKLERADEVKVCYVSHGLLGISGSADPLEAHIKNGRILRIKPLHYGHVRLYQLKAKGKTFTQPAKSLPYWVSLAYKKRVYSPNRVRYPLKRVDWSPENRNPQNRGKSGFVRITWDEALDIIEKEIKRIKEKYGLHAILVQADGHGQGGAVQTLHGNSAELFNRLGGFTQQVRNPDSWEGYYWGAMHVWGMEGGVQAGLPYQDAIFDDVLENTEMLIFTGCDPESTVAGFAGQIGSIICRWFKEAGIKIVAISPDCNFANAIHADKWIPILPNTDGALYLAIAYLWIKDGTYDKKFVQTHCVKFEEFKKYVMGEEDGIPKVPKWAERITGIPARTIRALARAWAKKRTSLAVLFGGPKIRGPYSHEVTRLEVICMAMQGLGNPGRQFFRSFYPAKGKLLPPIPHYPEIMSTIYHNPISRYTFEAVSPIFVPKVLVPEAILNPPISWFGTGAISAPREDQFKKYVFPPEGHPGIHMIWNENCCYVTCWNSKIIEAYRSPSIEFIVAVHPWLENDMVFADLILPAQTIFEHEDLIFSTRSFISMIAYQDKCVEPIGESKSDYEICRMIAQRLGIEDAFPTAEERIKEIYEKSYAATKLGISWKDFKKRKIVIPDFPTWEEWKGIQSEVAAEHGPTWGSKPGLTWYYELQEGKGLETPTGKIEISSTDLAKHFPDDDERPPVPRYIPYGETHQESLFHARAKKYPLLLISNHPRWRFHAQGDDITWLREIPTCKIKGQDGYLYEPVWIHPTDAAKRGIKHGDVVKVYNERGTVLCAAYVTERIKPGSVQVHHGARADLISINPLIDRGGAIDLIVPPKPMSKNTVGQVCSGILVEVEKADISELMEKYLEAFKRALHPDVGPCYETWVVESEV